MCCEKWHPPHRRPQHAPPGPLDQATFCPSGGNRSRPITAEPGRSSTRYRPFKPKSAKFTGDQLAGPVLFVGELTERERIR